MCGLLGAITWNLITWYYGLPSSSSHALIGGLVGAAVAAGATANWDVVVDKVVIPMFVSPVVAFSLGFAVMLGDHVGLPQGQPEPREPRLQDGADRALPRPWRSATASRTRRRRWA